MRIQFISRAVQQAVSSQASAPLKLKTASSLTQHFAAAHNCSQSPQPSLTAPLDHGQRASRFKSLLCKVYDSVASSFAKTKYFLQLDAWAMSGKAGDHCWKAVAAIKQAYRSGSSTLDLSGRGLRSLPDLSPLHSVMQLDLRNNHLSSLERIASLTQLKTLILAGCSSTDDPRSFQSKPLDSLLPLSKLHELQELDLSFCAITDSGSLQHLTELTQLTKLNLNDNRIQSDGRLLSFAKLTGLKELNLARCNIPNLELFLDWTELNQLTKLDLSNNRAQSGKLWHFVSRLDGLEELSLNYCGLLEISGLDFLRNLTKLDLMVNSIQSVAPLSLLTDLQHLRLDFNPTLKTVSQLSSLTKLKTLNLDYCELTDLEWLQNLKNLEGENNPIYSAPITWYNEDFQKDASLGRKEALTGAGPVKIKTLISLAIFNSRLNVTWARENRAFIEQLLIAADGDPRLKLDRDELHDEATRWGA